MHKLKLLVLIVMEKEKKLVGVVIVIMGQYFAIHAMVKEVFHRQQPVILVEEAEKSVGKKHKHVLVAEVLVLCIKHVEDVKEADK